MKIRDYMKELSKAKPGDLTLPGLPIPFGEGDILGMKLLLWAYDNMPGKTVGELNEALDSAKWWHTYFASIGSVRGREQ